VNEDAERRWKDPWPTRSEWFDVAWNGKAHHWYSIEYLVLCLDTTEMAYDSPMFAGDPCPLPWNPRLASADELRDDGFTL
jgi:hypothetical protein